MSHPAKLGPLFLALILTNICFSVFASEQKLSQIEIANEIQQQLEQNLYQLPPRIQGHYGIRMYRMTGNDKYANSALTDLYVVTEAQEFFGCRADDKTFVNSASNKAISDLGNGPRAKARKKALAPFPEFLFYSDILLRYASRINEFGLKGPCNEKITHALKSFDLSKGLTDEKMIEAWSAQLANYVYWAKQLGIADYREQYKIAFQNTYPNNKDSQLTKKQFKNKIYGMTHFIFAASEYYQKKVSKEEFAWILNYFEQNIDRIINQTTPDIIAEVGISFLLADEEDNPVVSLTREAVTQAYDPEYKMIPSPRGNPDLAMGEHRNVLAIMLINWTQELHQGPFLNKIKATQKNLPQGVKAIN